MSTLWILYVEFYRNTHWEQKERHVVVLTVPTPNIRKISSLASYCAKCSKPTNKNPWFYQQICSYIIHLSYAKLSTKSNKPFIRLEWWEWFIWRKVSKLQIKTSINETERRVIYAFSYALIRRMRTFSYSFIIRILYVLCEYLLTVTPFQAELHNSRQLKLCTQAYPYSKFCAALLSQFLSIYDTLLSNQIVNMSTKFIFENLNGFNYFESFSCVLACKPIISVRKLLTRQQTLFQTKENLSCNRGLSLFLEILGKLLFFQWQRTNSFLSHKNLTCISCQRLAKIPRGS